jgi:hypothetical protein
VIICGKDEWLAASVTIPLSCADSSRQPHDVDPVGGTTGTGFLTVDARFLGLLLMLKKKLKSTGRTLTFVGLSHELERISRLNSFDVN